MYHIHPIYAFFYWDCTSVQNFRAIGPLFMEILHFKDLGDTSVASECSLGVNLVINNFVCTFWILHLCIKFEGNQTITYGDITFWRFGGYKSHERMQFGANLVIDNLLYVASGTSPLYKIWKQSDHYLWRHCILKIAVLFGCERSYSSARRGSNFNSNSGGGGGGGDIYPHIKFELVLTSSRRTQTRRRR